MSDNNKPQFGINDLINKIKGRDGVENTAEDNADSIIEETSAEVPSLQSLYGRKGWLTAQRNKEEKDSESYKAIQEQIDELNAEIEERKKSKEKLFGNKVAPVDPEKEPKSNNNPFNVLAQKEKINALPDLETLILQARAYDSNKDKEFYDESMRTSNAAQTAIFNEPAKASFNPPASLLNQLTSQFRKLVPAGLGALAGLATPTLLAKFACSTALSAVAPFAAPVLGFALGFSFNLGADLKANYNKNLTLTQNFKGAFQAGGTLRNKEAYKNAFKAGAVGGITAFAVSELFEAFMPEAMKPETACAPEPEPVVAPEPEPVVAPEPTPATEPEPVVVPEPTILGADDIIDPAMLLDLQQNDMEFIDKLVEHGMNNNVDPALMDTLRSQLETGFDFIDSNASADAMKEFNALLEGAMDPSSPEGASITAEEYTSILSGFIEKLSDPDIYKTDTVGVVDDSYLQASVREGIINQSQALRATI